MIQRRFLSGIVIQAAGAGARERIVREQNSADIWKGQLFVEGDVLIKNSGTPLGVPE